MHTKKAALLIIAATVLLAQSASAAIKHSVGIARDVTTDDVRYIEHHQYLENGEHIVHYYDTSNNVLLKKKMRYTGLPQHPTLMQSDYQTNTDISIQRENNVATMTITKDDLQSGKSNQFSFELTEDTIIDAGFDAYLQDNRALFNKQPKQKVKFAVAGQSRLIDMNISLTGEQNGLTSYRIEPANWLIRMLIPEITLQYDDAGQLVRYKGFSNLKPGKDDSRTVVIDFEHYTIDQPISPPQSLPDTAWFSGLSGR